MPNPPPSDALDASVAGAGGKWKRGPTPPPSAVAEEPQSAPSAAKLGGAGAGGRRKAAVKEEAGTAVLVEEDGAEGNPAEGPVGGAAAAPKGKGKAAAAAAAPAPAPASAPVEVQEEEEELLGFKSARDRFDELSEQAGLEAAAALGGKEGPGVWAAGARRVAVGGCAVDFEKSVALVLDPEAEMRRREGAAAAGAAGGGAGGSHKRQRWVWCVGNVCCVVLIVACHGA
jgi:hypothetical protein